MKNKSVSQSVLTGLFVVLVLAASNSIVRAQCTTTTWITPMPGTGDWFSATNWNNCVPNEDVDASINNVGAAQINSGAPAVAKSLILGDNQGNSGQVVVDGPTILLEVLPRCEVNTPGNIYIGNRGSGALTITNGGTVWNGYGYIAAVANPTRPVSNGKVIMSGAGTVWNLSGNQCTGAGLFIGCTATSDSGGTALLSVENGATIEVLNSVDAPGVKVGLSGTLTGNGNLNLTGSTSLSQTAKVFGTLGPAGTITVEGNLALVTNTANTVCHVTPQAWDSVYVGQTTGGGHATLGGRLTVIMNGTFTPGTSFTLVHAEAGLNQTTFDNYSIMSPSNGLCFTPIIQYDANNVKLYLEPCE